MSQTHFQDYDSDGRPAADRNRNGRTVDCPQCGRTELLDPQVTEYGWWVGDCHGCGKELRYGDAISED